MHQLLSHFNTCNTNKRYCTRAHITVTLNIRKCLCTDQGNGSVCHQNAIFKTILKTSYSTKTTLWNNITSNMARKNIFRWLDVEFVFNSKFRLTPSLTYCLSTRLETKQSSVWPQFYTTTANSPVGCAFWGSNECGALLQAVNPYQGVNFLNQLSNIFRYHNII